MGVIPRFFPLLGTSDTQSVPKEKFLRLTATKKALKMRALKKTYPTEIFSLDGKYCNQYSGISRSFSPPLSTIRYSRCSYTSKNKRH